MGVAERRERERQARKETVLQAARTVLLERGLRATTTKEIAEHCEFSEATLFFYFKNKDEILLSLIFESIEFWAKGLEALGRRKLVPEQIFDEIWRYHERVYEAHPEYYVISAYLAQPHVLESVSGEVKEQISRRSGENFRRLAKLLEGASDAASGRVLADTIWSAFLGLIILGTAQKNLGLAEASLGRKDRAKVFDILKSGIMEGTGR